MMADPSADRREGVFLLDQLQGLLGFSLSRETDIALNIDVGRTAYLARRGFPFLSSGLARNSAAAGALLIVTEDDACLRVFGDGTLRAGLYTDGLIAVLADVDTPHEIELPVHRFGTLSPDGKILDPVGGIGRIVLLFARDFAGFTSPAGKFFDHQSIFSHGRASSFFSG
jgi:hypothetical protein